MLKLFFVFTSLLLVIPCQAKTICVDAYGLVWQGAVWSLGIQSDKAWNPDPPDGQEFVSITPTLSWKAGIDAQWHVIYFGTSFDDVNDSIVQPLVPPPLSYKGYQPVGDEDWDPITDGGLTFDFTTTYYWRIDEGHEELPPPIVGGTVIKGDVWSFTTEAQPIFVDIDAAGANDGTSWEDAYKHLQDALTDAGSAVKPVEIRVAQGIYKPDQSSANPNGSGNRYATFQLINGVTLKGGYAGYGEPDPDTRDIGLYETILSGDLAGNDVEVNDPCDLLTDPTRDENCYHVVTGSDTDENSVLDGFTIIGGNANGSKPNNLGGAMHNNSGSPSVFNCTFSGNTAVWWGGGMCNYSDSSPTLAKCTFSNNSAGYQGGGVYNYSDSNPVLTHCSFGGNYADWHGGGMYNYINSSPTLTNCTFSGNSARGVGGGMANMQESNPILTGCTFSRNSADSKAGGMANTNFSSPVLTNCTFAGNCTNWHGGGIGNRASSPRITNCMFSGNHAYYGGAMHSDSGSSPILTNCTFSDNSAAFGGGMYNVGDGDPILTNCILWGNSPEEIFGDAPALTYSNVGGGWAGLGNIDTDPCFVDPCNGDYHLKSQAGRWDPNSESWIQDDVTSPCIDAGNPGCPVGDEQEPNGNRRNMGAYGGTAEASKSPTYWRSIADMTNDWIVDSNDLKVFVDYWLQTGLCIPSDLNRSHFVDLNDFALLAGNWKLTRNRAPVANAGPDITAYVNGYGSSCCVCLDIRPVGLIIMDGSDSYDPDGDTLTYIWQAPIPWLLYGIGCYDDVVEAANPTGEFPVGSTTVRLTVSDGELSDTDSLVVTVLSP